MRMRGREGGGYDQFDRLDIYYDQYYSDDMKYVAAAKFKEQCLAILDRVDPAGIIITKHGKPVARLTPIRSSSAHLIGALKGKIRVRGPILSTGIKWDAES